MDEPRTVKKVDIGDCVGWIKNSKCYHVFRIVYSDGLETTGKWPALDILVEYEKDLPEDVIQKLEQHVEQEL